MNRTRELLTEVGGKSVEYSQAHKLLHNLGPCSDEESEEIWPFEHSPYSFL